MSVRVDQRRLAAIAGWLGLCLIVLIGTGTLAPAAADAQPAKKRNAARELAEKYSPIMMIRERDQKEKESLCDTAGEQYQPMAVNALFDNPDVTLRRNRPDGETEPITEAPSLAEVANSNKNAYIDLRGEPLGDTCVFAKDFDALKLAGRAPEVVYAHISREPGHPGIALQYWFFWYFNEFNDLHEGDWEGMQITFDAGSPGQALKGVPDEMVLFQHGGGERAEWGDPKVEREGSHPVVYPAAGSHATFYFPAVFVGNGSNGSGVGCDNTSEPLRRLDPEAVLLPEQPSDRGRFAWLAFDGRWGQKEKGFNNGPTGPQTKTQWSEPFTWMSQQRRSSPRMPGGSVVGPQASGVFCGVIAEVTGLMNLQQAQPLSAYLIAIVLLVAFLLLVVITKWRPIQTGMLRARRTYGQIMGAAATLYGRNWRPLVVLAAIAVPIVGGTQFLADLLGDTTSGNKLALVASDLVNTFGRPVAGAIVAAMIIVYVRGLITPDHAAGVRASLAGTKARFWRVVLAQLGATVGVSLMAITIVGIPFALRYLVAWSFVQQEVLLTDKSLRESFRSSSELVRGRWWHTLRTILVLQLLLVVLGPFLGLFMIFTPLPLPLVNLIASLIYALMIPFAALGATLLYFDLQVREETEPVPPKRSWFRRPGRPKPSPDAAPTLTGGSSPV